MTPSILAIDPGPESSGWLWLSGGLVMRSEQIDNKAIIPTLIDKPDFYYSHIAIECMECFGMAVGKEVFETCYWIGRIMQAAEHRALPFVRVYRGDVKIELCRTARAKDPNIRQALIDKFGPRGTKKAPGPTYGVSGHGWSALAVAWYASQKIGWNGEVVK